jgi:plastocyanin
MTTETPELDEKEANSEGAEAAGEEQPAIPAPAQASFWQRPNVDRYLVPLLLPVAIVGGVVMFVVNISRIFLVSHGNTAVVVGTIITLVILLGAAVLSASPSMRSSSLALVTGAFVLTILMGGWLSLGNAEPEGEAGEALPTEGPFSNQLGFESTNQLVFVPDAASTETGIVKVTLTNGGGEHTLHFEDGETLSPTLSVQAGGDVAEGRAFFGEPGEYVFYCTIPGDRRR